jgi:hypothetical protein
MEGERNKKREVLKTENLTLVPTLLPREGTLITLAKMMMKKKKIGKIDDYDSRKAMANRENRLGRCFGSSAPHRCRSVS